MVDVSFFNQGLLSDYRQFITQVVNQVGVSFQGTHVGIVEYAEGAFTRILLSRGISVQEVANALQTLGSTPAGRNSGNSNRQLQTGLDEVIAHWDNPSENRQNYPNAIVYLTAGYPFNPTLVAQLPNIQQQANTIKGRQQVVRKKNLFSLRRKNCQN